MNVYGELTRAQLENLPGAPTVNPAAPGRAFYRSDLLEAYLDDGVVIKQILCNDQKINVGTSGTAVNNLRIYRGANGKLAVVIGSDATAEASITSANLAQVAFAHETFTDAGKPASAIAGRIIFATDLLSLEVDTGTQWIVFKSDLPNQLLNGDFSIWQRQTTLAFNQAAGATYLPDRWYGRCNATGASVTISRVTGTSTGVLYGCSVAHTVGGASGTGPELHQDLENQVAIQLYNQTATFTCQLKATGTTTQIGLQFMYKTSEAKVDTTIGSETLVTVNTGGFVTGTITQALGTSMTTSGIVGIRIRVTAVSSGNLYDNAVGFVIEKCGLYKSPTIISDVRRQYVDLGLELHACQRYYEKSYDLATFPGAVSTNGSVYGATYGGSTTAQNCNIYFKALKRAVPTMTAYNAVTGASGTWQDSSASNKAITFSPIGQHSAVAFMTATAAASINGHWTADAEI